MLQFEYRLGSLNSTNERIWPTCNTYSFQQVQNCTSARPTRPQLAVLLDQISKKIFQYLQLIKSLLATPAVAYRFIVTAAAWRLSSSGTCDSVSVCLNWTVDWGQFVYCKLNSELGADCLLQTEQWTGGRLLIANWTVNWGQIAYCKLNSELGADCLLQTEQWTGGRLLIANWTVNWVRLLIANWTVNWGQSAYCKLNSELGADCLLQTQPVALWTYFVSVALAQSACKHNSAMSDTFSSHRNHSTLFLAPDLAWN